MFGLWEQQGIQVHYFYRLQTLPLHCRDACHALRDAVFVAIQAVELKADKVLWLGKCDNGKDKYPLAKKGHTMEKLREKMHLRPRTNIIAAVTRVRNALAHATHTFFQSRGFLYVHTPLITCADAEGAGELFQVGSG